MEAINIADSIYANIEKQLDNMPSQVQEAILFSISSDSIIAKAIIHSAKKRFGVPNLHPHPIVLLPHPVYDPHGDGPSKTNPRSCRELLTPKSNEQRAKSMSYPSIRAIAPYISPARRRRPDRRRGLLDRSKSTKSYRLITGDADMFKAFRLKSYEI